VHDVAHWLPVHILPVGQQWLLVQYEPERHWLFDVQPDAPSAILHGELGTDVPELPKSALPASFVTSQAFPEPQLMVDIAIH
jgi:hypothetical protein